MDEKLGIANETIAECPLNGLRINFENGTFEGISGEVKW
jgi:hypothetical protein